MSRQIIISSMNDLRNFLDGADIDTVSDWSAVVDRVADNITSYDACPDFGQDWSEFLGSFDFCRLAIEADDALIMEEGK
jgi:hypothetical protein